MKLQKILDTIGDRTTCLKLNYEWELDKYGRIRPTMDADLTLDTEVAVNYYWFYHLDPRLSYGEQKEVGNAIETHDYETFLKWYERFKYEPLEYFPATASLYVPDCHIGELLIAYDPDIFALIEFQESECG